MADQAQGPDVVQVAFAAALHHRDNVIRVPQGFSANPLQSPTRQQVLPMTPARSLQVDIRGTAIHPAKGANAPIARKHLLAQIAGVRANAPFMHTPIRAEGEPAGRDLEIAPPTESPAVLPSR